MKGKNFSEIVIKLYILMIVFSFCHKTKPLEFEDMTHIYLYGVHIYSQDPPPDMNGLGSVKN